MEAGEEQKRKGRKVKYHITSGSHHRTLEVKVHTRTFLILAPPSPPLTIKKS